MVGRPSRDQLLVALATATRFGSGVLMGTGLAVVVERLGGTPLAVGALFSAYFFGLMVFAPAWGAVADATGRRRAVLVGTGLCATLAVLPLLVASDVWALVGLRGLYAVFAAGFPPVMLAVVSERGGDVARGRAIGFFNSVRAGGIGGGQFFAGALLGLAAPATLYLVVAGASLVSTVAASMLVDADAPTAARTRGLDVREVLAEVRSRLVPAPGERAHLQTNGLSWLYLALALRHTNVMGVMSLMPVFLTREVGAPEVVMGSLLALNPGTQTVFMYLFGRTADTAGRKPLILGGMVASGAFGVVAALATLPAGLPTRVLVAGAGFVLLAAAFSAMTTGSLAFIGDVAPRGRESELMGLRTTAKGVGGVVGPVLVGGVATVASMRLAFVVAAVLAVAGAVLVGAHLVETDAVDVDRPSTAD